MDTVSASPDHNHPRMGIALSTAQYAFYQSTYLEVFTPEGQHMEYLGKTLRQEHEEYQTYRLRDQVALVACLLGGIDDEIKLPLPAVLGLTELLCRMQEDWKRR